MEALNGNLSALDAGAPYNQYMDNHVGLSVADMRPYLARLEADNVPYFTRRQSALDAGCDVFVQLPNNGIIVELACGAPDCCPARIQPIGWDLCKPVAVPAALGAEAATADAIGAPTTRPSAGRLPSSMWPWKMTFASSDPESAADFAVRALGAHHIPHPPSLSDRCGRVRWVQFPPPAGAAAPHGAGYGGYQLCAPGDRTRHHEDTRG